MTKSAALPPSIFFDALGVWYISAQGTAIRRQLDRRRGVISLVRLLEDIARNPDVATRERHLLAWGDPEDELNRNEANANFDKFSGSSNRDEIDAAKARADVQRLERVGDVVKGFVDETIAHTAEERRRDVPTFDHLNEAIDEVAYLVGKYTSLLEAAMIAQYEPVIQADWKAPFRQAWLVEPDPGQQPPG